MKLSVLKEAKQANSDPSTKVLGRLFHDVKANEPNATINDIAQYCAAMMAEHIHEDWDRPQIHEMCFEGLPTLKDNPRAISNQLQYYYDAETGEDYDSLVQSVVKFLQDGRLM